MPSISARATLKYCGVLSPDIAWTTDVYDKNHIPTSSRKTKSVIRGVRDNRPHPQDSGERVHFEGLERKALLSPPSLNLRFDIFELRETKLPVRLINIANYRRLVQGHETPLMVKGDIEDVSSELDNESLKLHFLNETARAILLSTS
ncbi:hypothetical protein TNCV_3844001 [Trichonephila clavipes]|nr:hypothetical protein TNCV_3844001 [Trichonephila clavipes]